MTLFVILPLVIIVVIALVVSIKIVNTGELYVIERLGQYHRCLQPGWHLIIPFIDFVRAKISTKQQILDIEPQSVITKDNVKVSIDNVIFYRIMDAQAAVYNIEDYKAGIIYSTITNVRNIIGNMSLDEILSGRDKINKELLATIDLITDAYGIKILSVEIKNIIPPGGILEAMEKEMRAERDKRAILLQAEASKQSAIAEAQGHKEAQILEAEAEKEAEIRRAEGMKQSQILESEGKAKAIEAIAQAEAEAIQKVNEAIIKSGTNEVVIAIRQLDALSALASNPANKLILPTDVVSSLGSVAAIADTLSANRTSKPDPQEEEIKIS